MHLDTRFTAFMCYDEHCFLLLLYSSLAVGTKSGYRLYSLSSVDTLEQIYENGKLKSAKCCIILIRDRTVSVIKN